MCRASYAASLYLFLYKLDCFPLHFFALFQTLILYEQIKIHFGLNINFNSYMLYIYILVDLYLYFILGAMKTILFCREYKESLESKRRLSISYLIYKVTWVDSVHFMLFYSSNFYSKYAVNIRVSVMRWLQIAQLIRAP